MKFDALAVTYWANADYPSYALWRGPASTRATPGMTEYEAELASAATEARHRFPNEIAALEAKREEFLKRRVAA